MSRRLCALALALAFCTGCVSHTHATRFNGVPGLRGEPVEYQDTTAYSFNALFIFELWGNTDMESVVDDFTAEASARGATRVHVTETSRTVYWYVFPPLSFFFHPVASTVRGTVEGTTGE